MGVSTNALLFFGFSFAGEGQDEESPPYIMDDGEWQYDYAKRLTRLVDTSGAWTPEGNYAHPEGPAREASQKEHRKYTEAVRKLASDSGCDIGTHCSKDYPTYYVYLSAHHKCANRGHPIQVTKAEMSVGQNEVDRLKAFCEVMGIKWSEPSWFLASDWS